MLIISPNYADKPDTQRLIDAAKKRNINTFVVKNSLEETLGERISLVAFDKYAFYGDSAFVEFMAQQMHLNVYSNSLDWITKLPLPLVKRMILSLTIGQIKNLNEENRSRINKAFLEPVDDHEFHPGVYGKKLPNIPDSRSILIHQDVDWQIKFRFVIINGKIETKCCYKIENTFNTPCIHNVAYKAREITPEAFVRTVIDHCNLAPSCILDVGVTEEKGWGVVGTYPVWSSDIYGCDPDKFLKALFASCHPIN